MLRIRQKAYGLIDDLVDAGVHFSGLYKSPITMANPPTKQAVSLEQLTMVTMNIVGCTPSKHVPLGWGKYKSADAFRNEILRTDPDILALQECTSHVVTQADAMFPGYTVVGDTRSHADYVLLLVRKGIEASRVPISLVDGIQIPAVLAKLTYGNREVLVSSVHLFPWGVEGSVVRQQQMEALVKTSGNTFMVVAGDTNMRVAEDKTMEDSFRLVEFWKLAGSDLKTKWTWDTLDHGTHFNRFYGDRTYSYHARFDRIYATQQESPEAPKLSVLSFSLIANKPVTNKFHFLSDHFGISTRFQLDWHESDGDN